MLDIDRSIQFRNPRLDDIHAHAATRNIRNDFGRAETGAPDEIDDLAVRQAVGDRLRATRPRSTICWRSLLDIDAFAVVANRDQDVIAAVGRFEARLRRPPDLPLAVADLGRFDPVVDRIADEMHQRIAQFVDHPLIELGFFSVNFELDLLPEVEGDVADYAFETAEQGRTPAPSACRAHPVADRRKRASSGRSLR